MSKVHHEFRRPMPDDFADTFIEHGHDRILEELHRASWQTVGRWIRQLPDEVREAREEHLQKTRWPNGRPGPNRRRNYVMGNRLNREKRPEA